VAEAGEGEFVLEAAMGFAVLLAAEVLVRQLAEKRQFFPAIQTLHSASVILPLISSARRRGITMRKSTEFIATRGGEY
jgi:F0F1-type ATP synthase beta subunit